MIVILADSCVCAGTQELAVVQGELEQKEVRSPSIQPHHPLLLNFLQQLSNPLR
jgi:hypothetical protein